MDAVGCVFPRRELACFANFFAWRNWASQPGWLWALHLDMRHLAKVNLPLFLQEKRGKKLERRRHREWRAVRRVNDREAVDATFGDSSAILRLVAGDYSPPTERFAKKGRVTFVAPANFSLLDNPVECLEALQRFAAQLCIPRVRQVHVDLGSVTAYDVGANALLDVLVDEVHWKAKRSKRKIRWTGRYPANAALRRLAKALGVIKKLEVEHEYPEAQVAAKLEAFEDRCRHYIRAVRPSETEKKARVTQRFADHLGGCLGRIGRSFTPESRHLLCSYITEVLDNAEQHAGMFDWTVQGYLDTHSHPWICEIVIFNYGTSIAETFKALDPQSYTRRMIEPYLEAHASKGFFRPGWKPDDLYTLIALQQSVSTKNFSDRDTRGNGTVDLIRFFHKLCLECRTGGTDLAPKMALISGRTRILFDGTYGMKPNPVGLGVIAFNVENDLHLTPDPTYVMSMSSVTFPGTVLSIKFPLSPEQSTTQTVGVAHATGHD